MERNSLKMIQFGLNKVVALNKQSDEFQLCYKIFDVLWVKDDGHETNLMKLPLKNRRKVLQRIVRERSGKIEVVLHE